MFKNCVLADYYIRVLFHIILVVLLKFSHDNYNEHIFLIAMLPYSNAPY